MNKKVFNLFIFWVSIVVIVLVAAYAISSMYSNYVYQETHDYLYEINKLIKDIDFKTAEVSGSMIYLYDERGDLLDEIDLSQFDKNVRILNIQKKDSVIYFIIDRAVDDEIGFIFINDETNKIFDGITYFERIGGNSYMYKS